MDAAMRSRRRLWVAAAAGFAVACASTGARDQSEIAEHSSNTASPGVAAPPPTQETELGARPSAPLAADRLLELPSIRVKVLDFARGDAAWSALRAGSSANAPPPSEREYALVRVRVTGVAPESWIGCGEFRVVGADRVVYVHGGQLLTEPLRSKKLEAGQDAEGWCAYSIRASDHGLILMVDDPAFAHADVVRYVALERGASLPEISSSEIAPTQAIGASLRTPAEPSSEVVTRDWSVTVIEVVRGEDARRLVVSANEKNAPPSEGREYVAIKLRAQYHAQSERPGLLTASAFRIIGGNGELYDAPIALDVSPQLSRTLFPGGEHTGWAVFQIDPADTGAVLRFEPYFPDRDVRYLALGRTTARAAPPREPAEITADSKAGGS